MARLSKLLASGVMQPSTLGGGGEGLGGGGGGKGVGGCAGGGVVGGGDQTTHDPSFSVARLSKLCASGAMQPGTRNMHASSSATLASEA